MSIQRKANRKRAVEQWDTLYKTLKSCGAQIELIAPAQGLPDLCFTANAGLLYKGRIILAHFKVNERRGEEPHYQAWFEQAGFKVINHAGIDQIDAFFEGAGDALLAGDLLFAGYGFRSEKKFYEEANYLDHKKMVYYELSNPYFYHIDTCFCPLNEKQALWFPNAFTKDSQKRMADHIELIEVVEPEAKRFACNSVVIDKHIVVPSGCLQISESLKKLGLTVHICEIDEYIKAGGACKCLIMQIG
jgi:N-dimethylarginine dimethylaminohydrolase